MTSARMIVVLQRMIHEPEDPEDPASVEAFELDEWLLVVAQDAETKRPIWNMEELTGRTIFGDELPAEVTPRTKKLLVVGRYDVFPVQSYEGYDWDDEFTVESVRVLSEFDGTERWPDEAR